MECKRYSLKRGNIDRTKKYMNRNNPSIICVFCFCIDFQRIKSEMSCLPDTKRWIHGFPLFQGSRVHSHQDRQIGWNPTSPASNISPLNIKPHDAINQAHTKMNNQIPHNCRKKWPGVSNSFFREGYLCLSFCYFTMVSDYDVQFDVGRGK